MSTHVSVAQAARMSSRSEKTIRRWIANGKLPAQKVDGVFAINTADLAQPAGDMSSPVSSPEVDTDVHPPTDMRLDIQRAEAMAAYTRTLLEPLVGHVAALEGTIRDQAEQLGQLRAELAALKSPRWGFPAITISACGNGLWQTATLLAIVAVVVLLAAWR